MKDFRSDDLFEYTSGRWLYNDALRHAERRRVFDVNGLCRLAAESVHRSPEEIISFAKLAEGGFNRTFLITMRDGFEMVARIPYPLTVPKSYAVASEVATMSFLRSYGLPVPEVYGYSPTLDNVAETEYIFMEFVRGTKMTDAWADLQDSDIISIMRQLVQLERQMMSFSFPASGSLYYSQDLETLHGKPGVQLKDKLYSVGPDVRINLWYGRRSQLDIDRGPYKTAEAVLAGAAHKELAYLKQFGEPLLPFRRIRREAFKFQKQSPLDHIENLNRYLLIAPHIISSDSNLNGFHIRHPDLQPSNIMLAKSPDSGWKIVGLLDWQHASILPLFLLAGVPDRLQTDDLSPSPTPPSMPENSHDLSEERREYTVDLYRQRLVHYYYLQNTVECNVFHFAALREPLGDLRRRLFTCADDMWEGETLDLKVALIHATKNWEELAGKDVPCPIAFDDEDVQRTLALEEEQREMEKTMGPIYGMLGIIGPAAWVTAEEYEGAMKRSEKLKRDVMTNAESEEERAQILEHWFLDDMDENKYF
ncbi:protein kinase subdomain-containing protein PKL/CAK/Fmp29 [Panus rudis PR-1116 ss-1]|nr:protein kinase subdomain-containing protein PKL/CAK/Fmp29 [Panus rudis PR-1116 ss-1]